MENPTEFSSFEIRFGILTALRSRRDQFACAVEYGPGRVRVGSAAQSYVAVSS